MAFLSAASSSGTKPCVHHTSAVFATAAAIKGRASVPLAAKPRELRSTERRLRFPMSVSFPVLGATRHFRGHFCLDKLKWPPVSRRVNRFISLGLRPFSSSRRTVSPITPGSRRIRHFVGISRVLTLQQVPAVWFSDDIGLLGHVERILISAGHERFVLLNMRAVS